MGEAHPHWEGRPLHLKSTDASFLIKNIFTAISGLVRGQIFGCPELAGFTQKSRHEQLLEAQERGRPRAMQEGRGVGRRRRCRSEEQRPLRTPAASPCPSLPDRSVADLPPLPAGRPQGLPGSRASQPQCLPCRTEVPISSTAPALAPRAVATATLLSVPQARTSPPSRVQVPRFLQPTRAVPQPWTFPRVAFYLLIDGRYPVLRKTGSWRAGVPVHWCSKALEKIKRFICMLVMCLLEPTFMRNHVSKC